MSGPIAPPMGRYGMLDMIGVRNFNFLSSVVAQQIQKLTTTPRLAMKVITGCYKIIPTTAVEIEADLQPARIRLQTKVLQAITRMQFFFTRHSLQESFSSALGTRTTQTTHRSNPVMGFGRIEAGIWVLSIRL